MTILALAGTSTFRVMRSSDIIEIPEVNIANDSRVTIGYGALHGTVYIPYTVNNVTDKDLYELCVDIKLASTDSPEELALIKKPSISTGESPC